MKTLTADKVYSKEIAYTRDGHERTFMKYSFKSREQWYTLSGYGAKNVKQGETLSGIVTEKHFTKKDGSPGIELEFKLLSPVEADLVTRIEKLEAKVFGNSVAAQAPQESPAKQKDDWPPEDDPDLPF